MADTATLAGSRSASSRSRRPSPPRARCGASRASCCRWSTPIPRSTPCSTQVARMGERTGGRGRRRTPRRGSATTATDSQRVYLAHAFDIGAFNPCFPRVRLRSASTRETATGTRHVPGRLRGAAGSGARRLPRGVLRLRHPAPELRHRAVGQDALADREVPPADADPHRAALRHRARPKTTAG